MLWAAVVVDAQVQVRVRAQEREPVQVQVLVSLLVSVAVLQFPRALLRVERYLLRGVKSVALK